jgi:hypothetical protein
MDRCVRTIFNISLKRKLRDSRKPPILIGKGVSFVKRLTYVDDNYPDLFTPYSLYSNGDLFSCLSGIPHDVVLFYCVEVGYIFPCFILRGESVISDYSLSGHRTTVL